MLPALLRSILIGGGIRTAGGAMADVGAAVGSISKIGGGFSKIAGLAKSAANDSDSKQEKQSQSNNVIYGNFGMVGQAARQKTAMSGINAPNTVKPVNTNVSEKMPTEALLDTAIKYLISIDKTLKSQIEFEKKSYDQVVKDQREAIIETKADKFNFSDLKDKLSGLKLQTKDGFAGKALIGLGVLGTAAAIIAESLDTKELDALKENVAQFKTNFSWLGEMAKFIGFGGFAGFILGGKGGRLKGGLVGMVASHVLSRVFGGENSAIDPQTGRPATQSRAMSAGGYALSAAGVVMAGSYGLKKARDLRKGATWLSSTRGRKFLVILGRKLGKGLMGKIAKHLVRIVALVLLGATGAGAIPAIIGILASTAYIGFEVYSVATSIWDAWNESEDSVSQPAATAVSAAPVNSKSTAMSATKTSGPGITASSSSASSMSKSETGNPEAAQSFFESKGWTKEQAAGIVGNLVVESGLKTDAIGDSGNAYGIAQWNKRGSPERISNFQQVMGKSLYGSSFKDQLEFVNWELNNTERNAGNALRSVTTSDDAAAIVDKYYERSSGMHLERRQANAAAIVAGDYGKVSTGGASGYSGGGSNSISAMANSGIESLGRLFGTLGSSMVAPGVARDFSSSKSNTSDRINNESTNLHNDIMFGIKSKESSKKIESPTMPATSPGVPRARGSISSMDPNYNNLDVLTRYLAHFRLAA